MKTKAIFYHAGCPVCVDAEQGSRISEAESSGVKSVPALVIGENTYHINFGASINDLK